MDEVRDVEKNYLKNHAKSIFTLDAYSFSILKL